jgi:hypothetical protein
VISVLAALGAKLGKLKFVLLFLAVLGGGVIAIFTLGALKRDKAAISFRHKNSKQREMSDNIKNYERGRPPDRAFPFVSRTLDSL